MPVLHAATDLREDESDTLDAAHAVQAALLRLGFHSSLIRFDHDLRLFAALAADRPVAVFNLVEAFYGDDALAHMAPAMLEHHGLAFTGGQCHALAITRSKLLVKQWLHAAGISTPDWSTDGLNCLPEIRYIVKADQLHGSLGMDMQSVLNGEHVAAEIRRRQASYATPFLAERFIAGREFNVAVMSGKHDLRILPIQEILFLEFASGVPHIVDYAAKWDPGSGRYYNTPRQFGLEQREPALAAILQNTARACWKALALSGYGRVDFRVDEQGAAYVLEVNVNPAITPDAGFPAAAAAAGLDYDELIETLISACVEEPINPRNVTEHA
ncbi:MAG: D-alanine-D-alanine ligase [Granulosicoccus sp.]